MQNQPVSDEQPANDASGDRKGAPTRAVIAKKVGNSVDDLRNAIGHISPDDITQLPAVQDTRVPCRCSPHEIIQPYGSQTFDHPTDISKTTGKFSQSVAHKRTAIVANDLKRSNTPAPYLMNEGPA
ncbi:hypothetical protein DACRYDRAFT_111096 [Dacryopinax primogenitus]|uniref:Uncharacterized protein n=1 Tax=Dacryopinax primogenitus (strain DJM 731) TaxID=1858805 RepID=M5FXB4_DACPD|nr:uncharacterized protein DACRYDRAFT_111096 [Dacryopinax primogenitus]EJT98116.1 hypothetical protein DACRYDRAFT_111096 [Dacryopinax primogenitus]